MMFVRENRIVARVLNIETEYEKDNKVFRNTEIEF